MTHKLATNTEMMRFLEKYNHFHDALLTSVKFSSSDYFSGKPPALIITGQFNAALTIHHYNYQENPGQRICYISMELHNLGSLSFCSGDGEEKSRHWTLTDMKISPAKDTPGKWLMTLITEKLDVPTGKWMKADLAQFEFKELSVSDSLVGN